MTKGLHGLIFRSGIFILLFTVVLIFWGCVSTIGREELAREYYNLGNAYFEIGKFQKAISYYRKAFGYDNTLKSSSYNLALAYIKTGELQKAIDILKNLLEEDPENLKVLEALSYAYHLNGDDESSITVLDQILRLSPENTDALNNKGIILWNGKDSDGDKIANGNYFYKLRAKSKLSKQKAEKIGKLIILK